MDLTRLLPASFNGVQFLTPSQSITWGVKTIVHNYPKSNRTEVEFMGLQRRQFALEIIVSGDNYISKREELISALNVGAYGSLIHPIDGEIKVAVLGDWTLSETNAELGYCKLSVSFQEVSDKDTPNEAETSVGQALTSIEKVLEKGRNFFNNNYATKFVENTKKMQARITDIADSVVFQAKKINKTVSDVRDQYAGFVDSSFGILKTNANLVVSQISEVESTIEEIFSTTQDIKNQAFEIAGDGLDMYDNINDMVEKVSEFGEYESRFNAIVNLFDDGDDVSVNDLTTENAENKTNTETVNTSIQTISLIYAYKTTFGINFLTNSELEQKRTILENQYAKVYEGLDIDTQSELDVLRKNINSYYNELDLYNVKTVKANGESLNVLLYKYYGNLDLYDYIRKLNNIINDAIIEGDIQILERDE